MSDHVLSEATFKHVVDVPLEKIDIAGWLFSLPDAEFRRCCVPDHIACGKTNAEDGRMMSINVEMIGQSLVVQHYVAEVAERHYCRMASVSDVFSANGRTRTKVLWELRAADAGDGRYEYTNTSGARRRRSFWHSSRRTGPRSSRPRPLDRRPRRIIAAAKRHSMPKALVAGAWRTAEVWARDQASGALRLPKQLAGSAPQ